MNEEETKNKKRYACLKCGETFFDKYRVRKFCSLKCRVPWNKDRKTKPNTVEQKRKAREFNLKNRIKPPVMKDEDHPEWKGEDVSYSGLHYWINRKLGKPKSCKFCNGITKLQWANIDGKYRRNLNDFIPLCFWCHREFDKDKWGSIKKKYG